MAIKQNANVFRVMVDPRGFMRDFSPAMRRYSWAIAWVFGTVLLMAKAFAFSLGVVYSAGYIFLGALIFGIPAGYIAIYLYSFFLYMTGKIFRGNATFQQVMDAYTWTRVVELFPLLSWLCLMALFGKYAFTPEFLDSQKYMFLVSALIGVQAVSQVWEVVILFHTLGEIQGLSAWITIWNVLFASVLFLIVDGAINWMFSSTVVMGSFSLMGSLFYR